jgi:hypothetical protein
MCPDDSIEVIGNAIADGSKFAVSDVLTFGSNRQRYNGSEKHR